MPRTADHDAASPATAPVLTPDGQRWLLERAAWLAAEPDQAGWSDDTYARGAAELARLNEILAQAITTEELPPEQPGVVELGDEASGSGMNRGLGGPSLHAEVADAPSRPSGSRQPGARARHASTPRRRSTQKRRLIAEASQGGTTR
jgi:hypothetical protein